MTEPVPAAPGNKTRQQFFLVVGIALLPALIAAVLVLSDWRPSGRSLARGELLQPVRPLPAQDWQALNAASAESRIGQGKWLLLTVAETQCSEACRQALYGMQQARLLTHKDMRRVERVLLTRDVPKAQAQEIGEHFPGTALYQARADLLNPIRKLLLEDGRDLEAWIFLIDPLGNLVLRYAPGSDTAGIHKDLTRLLKLSRIG